MRANGPTSRGAGRRWTADVPADRPDGPPPHLHAGRVVEHPQPRVAPVVVPEDGGQEAVREAERGEGVAERRLGGGGGGGHG